MDLTAKDLERFWSKVEKTEGCWLWTAAKSSEGYGRFKIKGKFYSPHRITFFLANGTITSGKDICHKCDNPPCVNPEHLFEGSRSDNMRDCLNKNRLVFNQHTGEQASYSILTEQDVLEIRSLYAAGVRIVDITKMFPQVTMSNITNVVKQITWRHLL